MTRIQQFSTLKPEQYENKSSDFLGNLLKANQLSGFEVYMDDIISRDKRLFSSQQELDSLVCALKSMYVNRLHCSYWAYPTSFLGGYEFKQLIDRFGSVEAVRSYYGDLTGEHMYRRWVEEYTLAKAIHASAYTFHLIDYAPIDGEWEFTIPKHIIVNFMVSMLQKLVNHLLTEGLLTEDSPVIEIETSGWGLEHGTQAAADYKLIYSQIYDPYHKIKIAWEINHLLHAVGCNPQTNQGEFFLPPNEITPDMRILMDQYKKNPPVFAQKWLEHEICDPLLIDKIGSIHLADNKLKMVRYFKNGLLQGEYYEKISSLATWEEKENYGVDIVLREYDNHLVFGTGILTSEFFHSLLEKIKAESADFVILHELKNSTDLKAALTQQQSAMKGN